MCVCWSSVPLWLDHFLGMFPPSFTHSIIDIVGDTLKSEPLGFLLVFLRCFSFVICTFFYPLLALFGSFPLFFFFTVIVFFCCCSVSWLHDLCFLLQRVFFSSWLHTRDGYMKTNARWTSGEDTLLPLNCVFFLKSIESYKGRKCLLWLYGAVVCDTFGNVLSGTARLKFLWPIQGEKKRGTAPLQFMDQL